MPITSLSRRHTLLFLSLFLAGAVLLMPLPARAETPPGGTDTVQVTVASPVGIQRDVRQVQLRFSEEVTALGDNQAPPAAAIVCKGSTDQAVGHWQNGRTWVAEFSKPLPDGVVCEVTPATLKSVGGKPVAVAPAWAFNTGGPRILNVSADTEDYDHPVYSVAALSMSAPIDVATLGNLHCSTDNVERAVRVLTGAERNAAYWQIWRLRRPVMPLQAIDDSWILAQCGAQPMPFQATVTWTVGKDLASISGVSSISDESRNYYVPPMLLGTLPNLLSAPELQLGANPVFVSDQFAAFDFLIPTDRVSLKNLRCDERAVRILSGEERRTVFSRLWKRFHSDVEAPTPGDNWVLAQCHHVPAPNNSLAWEWKPANVMGKHGVADEAAGMSTNAQPFVARHIAHPIYGPARSAEDPQAVFITSRPVDRASLSNLHCAVDGRDTPVKVLTDEAAAAAHTLLSWRYRNFSGTTPEGQYAIVAQCGTAPLPAGAIIRWTWGKNIATRDGLPNGADSVLELIVRPALWANPVCSQLLATEYCDHREDVAYAFSNDIARAEVPKLSLHGSSGHDYAARPAGKKLKDVRSVSFIGPFVDGESLSLVWQSDFRDTDGRELKRVAPEQAIVSHPPAYLGMVQSSGAYQWRSGQPLLWPLVVRHTEKMVKVRAWQFGHGPDSTPALLTLLEQSADHHFDTRIKINAEELLQPFALSSQLLQGMDGAPSIPVEQEVATSSGTAEMVGIPLKGYGAWLLEADSPLYREALGRRLAAMGTEIDKRFGEPRSEDNHDRFDTYYRNEFDNISREEKHMHMAVVQMTNLRINARLSQQGTSLIWLTAIDSGKPVGGASVELWSCEHKRLTAQTSDEQGRVLIDAINAPSCPWTDANGYIYREPRQWVWIVARNGEDVAALSTANSMGYTHSLTHLPGGMVAHTILDRSLFHPGETVSMQHIRRGTSASGWNVPPESEGILRIINPRNETLYTDAVHWHADGSATSTWTFPAGATLGEYHFDVTTPGGALASSGSFALEEFRIPLFSASLHSNTQWRGAEQELQLKSALSFKTGGAASGQGITIKGNYEFGSRWGLWFGESAESQAYLNKYHFMDDELPLFDMPDFDDIQLKLNRQGQAAITAPVPQAPGVMTLNAQMQFSDASGEIKTTSTQLLIFPEKYRVGLRVMASDKPNIVKLSAVLIDDKTRPRPGETITVDFAEADRQQRTRYAATGFSNIDLKSPRKEACIVHTDRRGVGECEIPWPYETKADGWSFRARATNASTASFLVTKSVFEWKPPAPIDAAPPPIFMRVNTKPAKTGDTERFEIRSPFLPATLLLTVEREGVLSSQVRTLTQPLETLDLHLDPNFAPGVIVNASLIRGAGQLSARDPESAPLSYHSEIYMLFDSITNQLAVEVRPEKTVASPGRPLKVTLKVRHASDNTPATHARVTLVAVDQGLLDLRANPTWELLQSFWQMRYRDVFIIEQVLSRLAPAIVGSMPDYMPEAERNALRSVALPTTMRKPEQAFSYDTGSNTGALEQVIKAIRAELNERRSPSKMSWTAKNNTNGIQRVEITGSSIRRVDAETRSPIQIITAEELSTSGHRPMDSEKAEEVRQRSNFSSLAHWQTDIELDENGAATATIDMPDSLTNWRIVALATEGSDRYGSGTSEVKTAQAVQILSGLPQTVRSGDTLQQKITLRNTSNKTVTLDLNAAATASLSADIPHAHNPVPAASMAARGLTYSQRLTLHFGESRVVQWPVTIPEGITRLDWQFSASEENHDVNFSDAMLVTQSVVPLAPVTVRESTMLQVDGTQTMTVAPPSDTISNAGGVRVSWQGSLVEGALDGARAWMRNYPYACMEQRSSKAAVSGDTQQWAKVVASLPQHMDKEGLVAYFPLASATDSGSEGLTAFLLDLSETYGLALPEQAKQRMQNALRAALLHTQYHDWTPKDYLLLQRLALQAAIAPDLGNAKPTVPPDLNLLPTLSLIDWVHYLLKTADTPERTTYLAAASSQLRSRYDIQGTRAVWRNDRDENLWWFMWTNDAAAARTALLAQQLSAIDPSWKYDAQLLIQGLITRQHRGAWSTTTGNAWGVAAIQHFAQGVERGPVTGSSSATLGGINKSTEWPQPASLQLPWPQDGAQAALRLTHHGTGVPWATVQILAATRSPAIIDHGVTVHKTISPYEQHVKGQWSEGDIMKVTLEMTADRDLPLLVVQDPIPSGATILGDGTRGFVPHYQYLWWNPTFIERTNDSFRAYYQRVWNGKWVTEYLLRLNNKGKFSFPATRIEVMYSPEIFGETPNADLTVEAGND